MLKVFKAFAFSRPTGRKARRGGQDDEFRSGRGDGAGEARSVPRCNWKGKRRMRAADFLRGHPLAMGTVLGQSELRLEQAGNSKCKST